MSKRDNTTTEPRSDRPPHPRPEPTAFAVLRSAVSRLRSDPRLAVPFLLAGVVFAAVDLIRRQDPIPAISEGGGDGVSVDVAFYLYPTGSPETLRPLGAIVELQPRYLLWAVALEAVALLAVGIAGWLVFRRALDRSTDSASAARYFGVLVLPVGLSRLLGEGQITFTDGGLVFGIPLLVLWALVFIRLFLFPVFLVDGCGVIEAARESRRTSRGAGWTIFGLILVFGLGSSLLGGLSGIGGAVSTAIVGPLHAVAAVVLYERLWLDHRLTLDRLA